VKFDRLRILGFKTFVDPTELVIEAGLTGVVGPNGCGKSNLVEALRWVMGETSHKSMRASGMDDVIFSGSAQRPARNHAEVVLRIDNAARQAPAQFNDADSLDISRRIEREEGSVYRVNGREVRARDVQLLFADAASGARSPSMVRQGQISEIIAAKPQARRRVLEDAAGVAGLHARRHDAELKLKAAEDNLARVSDVLQHIDAQIDGLKRQARQAERYRALAADIRKAEAIAALISWRGALADVETASRQLDLDTRAVAEAMAAQGAAERERAIAHHAIEPLRQKESAASEALQRLVIAREALDGEERRALGRLKELDQRLADLARDQERAEALAGDALAAIERLGREAADLAVPGDHAAGEAQARSRLDEAEAVVGAAEQRLQELQVQLAEASASRSAAEKALTDARARLNRIATLTAEAERQKAELSARAAALPDPAALRQAVAEAGAAVEAADKAAQAAERRLAEAREAEAALRPGLQEADRAAQRLETEARTIRKLFDSGAADLWPRALDQTRAAKGYEVALGAALGEDLDASTEASAPAHWAPSGDGAGDPPLPEGIAPLARFVTAPAALGRRLNQIGIVSRAEGARLAPLLRPGQRLVSVEGDLWRWDGFTAAAEAPSAAARRLAERNRLADVEAESALAIGRRDQARAGLDAAATGVRSAATEETAAREAARQARRAFDAARDTLTLGERRLAETRNRDVALDEALARLAGEREETGRAVAAAEAELATAATLGDLTEAVARQRAATAEARARAAELNAALQGFQREREMRARRIAAIAEETRAWQVRRDGAAVQTGDLTARVAAVTAERSALAGVPDDLATRRRVMQGEIETAEGERRIAADARAEGETVLAAFDRAARDALTALSTAREQRARAEARSEAVRERLAGAVAGIQDTLEVAPAELAERLGIGPGDTLPDSGANETRLADLRRERERIGAVNLRADEELREVEATRSDLTREVGELTEAIRRLRKGIESLNAEGRNRLIAAFEVVNGHFRELFARLFGGGTAELQLIESDDPLEAGLEILAHPPGKKPQVLTLLSGGEQALTATALIFAVFLTNPSPVCVLDEVDAPLDDANVERLCGLLTDMVQKTATRFVVITHNPITMARMDRLFGVTMAERGVSQLVSVDLGAAERLVEAG
jgi:chromosome segregation protein